MSSKNEGQKKRQPNYKIVPKANKVGGRLGRTRVDWLLSAIKS